MKKSNKTKIERTKSYAIIKDGIFFKEDFAKLPKNAVIFIDKGCLIVPKNDRKKK